MNNPYFSNRVEAALNLWRSREERFNKLFSSPLSSNTGLLKEKLACYERIAARYRGTSNWEERVALNLLRGELRQMEKKLYPNLLIRWLRRVLVTPAMRQKLIRQYNRTTTENSQALHRQLQQAGFPELSAKLDEQIRLGQQQFSIPVSYYVNDRERVDHQLSFTKGQAGQYHFDGYTTTLYNEAKPDEKRRQYFRADREHAVSAAKAYNLLSGRSVQNRETWLQLDFNDKDQNGNFRLKQFHSGYGYDLDKVLKQLPLKEQLDNGEMDRRKEKLKNGARISVSFVKDGKEKQFYIEANPQFKSVNIYDGHFRKITLQTALGNKAIETTKVIRKINEEQQTHAKKNGLKVGR